MNITNHTKLRYVQRVIGIADERESRQYLAQNEDSVLEGAKEMFEQSTYVWTGCIGGNKVSHFHLYDDMVLVVDEPKNAVVTMFRCDFGFPPTINKQTIKSLMSEISKLREKRIKRGQKVGDEVAKLEIQIEAMNAQIEAKKAELDTVYERRRVVEAELSVVKHEIGLIDVEIGSVATMLLSSLDLKRDIASKAI